MSADIPFTTAMARQILSTACPDVRVVSLAPLEAGYSSNHWIAETDEGRLLIKIPQRDQDLDHLQRLISNTALAAEHGIPVVRYRSLVPHDPAVGGPVLIQEFHDGDAAADVWNSLDEQRRTTLCRDLGTVIGRLHAITGPEFGPLPGGGTAGSLQEAVAAELDTLLGQVDAELRGEAGALRAAIEAEMDLLDAAASVPALVHGDLWLPNFLTDGDARISRVLDFEHALYADRFRDFGKLDEHIFDKFPQYRDVFLEAYAAAYPLPADWERRISLAHVLHALSMHVYFLRWSPQWAPEYADQARQWLAKRSS